MRVLQIGKFYPPQRGGMETVLHDLSRGLVARGHAVKVIVAAPGEDDARELVDGVQVERVGNWGTLRSVPLCPGLFASIRRNLRDFDPHVVHMHLPHPLGAVGWLTARDRRPLVVTYHSDIVRQRWLATLYGPFGTQLLRRAASIHVTSEGLLHASRVLRPHRRRCEVIPLGVDTEYWAQPSAARVQQWMDQFGPRFLLFVGRLVYYKGIDVLFEALRETTIPVVIAGDGPMRAEWETLSHVLGVAQQVQFVGDVSDAALVALYHAAHAFVLPSTAESEAFGLVQLEAMAAGRAVVAARASEGVGSVHVENETALLVPPRDPIALRRALVRLWADDELAARLGRAGRQRVRAFYELERVLDRMTEWLSRSAGQGRRTAA
jgi:glycosyltransferase involved in cell wall biosynthesis